MVTFHPDNAADATRYRECLTLDRVLESELDAVVEVTLLIAWVELDWDGEGATSLD